MPRTATAEPVQALPSVADVRDRVAKAEAAVAEAQQAWKYAVGQTETGRARPAAEATAMDALQTARRDLDRLHVVLASAEEREAGETALATEATMAKQDRATAAVFEALADAGQILELAVGQYVKAYQGATAAYNAARAEFVANPRLQGVMYHNVGEMTAAQISRAIGEGYPAPGARSVVLGHVTRRGGPLSLAAEFREIAEFATANLAGKKG